MEISDKKPFNNINNPNIKAFYYEISNANGTFLDFDYIIIKNYYAEKLSIAILLGDYNDDNNNNENNFEYVIENMTLMPNPNTEEDSEKYFIISKKNFKLFDKKFKENILIYKLRIFITQSANCWDIIKLKSIKLIKEQEFFNKNNLLYEMAPKQKIIIKDIGLNLLCDKEDINHYYIKYANNNKQNLNLNFIE